MLSTVEYNANEVTINHMDKRFTALITVFFLAFAVFIFTVVFQDPVNQLIRANVKNVASADKSLVFAWPLTQKADGVSIVKVDVFVRSPDNQPVAAKPVTIQTTLGEIVAVASTSDKSGKATFNLTSSTPGVATLTVTIDNTITTSKNISVKFE